MNVAGRPMVFSQDFPVSNVNFIFHAYLRHIHFSYICNEYEEFSIINLACMFLIIGLHWVTEVWSEKDFGSHH